MNLLKTSILTLACAACFASAQAMTACADNNSNNKASCAATHCERKNAPVVVGAARTDVYVPLLKGKRVALLSNQTGIVGNKHVLDVMLGQGIKVVTILSPEHGFRGKADAGEKVGNSIDEPTGIPIASLYDGSLPMPSKETMDKVDVVVVDLQDVGLRFYTYYVTMIHIMDACNKYGKQVVVFDRPNPNIMYVDGPILDMKFKSGVGYLPIPIVYGMTMGELARMANGEGWLDGGKKANLTVVPCENYTRHTRYQLPIAPSPNLPNMTSVYLYPSTCFFEGTPVSLGRGTLAPFQVYGHPDMKAGHDFTFTPRSIPGAKNPPQLDKLCYGTDLRNADPDSVIAGGINLNYVIDAYRTLNIGDKFFTRFFDLLAGGDGLRKMIMAGKSADEIKASWQPDIEKFKKQRQQYLLYSE